MTLRLSATITARPNRKAMMLLHVHVHVTLVQAEFAAVVQLLVKRLFVMRHLHLRKIIEETVISVT